MTDEEEYPESFFTFWNNDCYGRGFYDDGETQSVWDYDLNFYSTDPSLTHQVFHAPVFKKSTHISMPPVNHVHFPNKKR